MARILNQPPSFGHGPVLDPQEVHVAVEVTPGFHQSSRLVGWPLKVMRVSLPVASSIA
jgi:hypothetical protein